MSLFKRVSDNIRANINALLDKAEDPEKLLSQYLLDMEDDIADAEGAVAKQMAVAKKFRAQYEEASAIAVKREAQAVESLQREREDLARRALEDKKLQSARARDYQLLWEENEAIAEKLKAQLKEMKNECQKLKAKKDNLVARARTAKAQKGIYGSMGLAGESARRDFDRLEDKVLQLEAEARVSSEIRGTGKSLDEELAALGDYDIDRELKELREKIKNQQ